MRADLHLHTTFSDGKLTPGELVEIALKRNLQAIAITDHDTVDGIEPAKDAAKVIAGFKIVPGIEINAFLAHQEIHILGYYIDHRDKSLSRDLAVLQRQREERALEIVDKLVTLGLELDYSQVLSKATGSSVGRPHIAEVLVDKGYVESIPDAFQRYLNAGAPAYVPRKKLSPYDAIDIIKGYKGIPIIAHPGLMKDITILDSLIDCGLRGIEAHHIKHSVEQTKYFNELAKTNNLIVTGGSDSHDSLTIGHTVAPKGAIDALKAAKAELYSE